MKRRSKDSIRIVLYHSVPARDSHMFEEHLRFYRNRFKILSLSVAAELIRSGASGYGQCLAVTFDDGFKDNIEVAAPILRKYNIPACFFVVSGFISALPEDHDKLAHYNTMAFHKKEPVKNMNWADLKRLVSWGFEVGSHTHTHQRLSELSKTRVFEELTKSKQSIERHTGTEVRHFAWPWGKCQDVHPGFSEFTRELGYGSGLSGIRGLCDRKSDVFNLPRHGIEAQWPLFLVKFFIE